jgi:hypothetical protein
LSSHQSAFYNHNTKDDTVFCAPPRLFKLLVSSAALDTEFATQTPRVTAASASSQKEASQKPIENDEEEDCAKHQCKFKAQLRYVKQRAFPCRLMLLEIKCQIMISD